MKQKDAGISITHMTASLPYWAVEIPFGTIIHFCNFENIKADYSMPIKEVQPAYCLKAVPTVHTSRKGPLIGLIILTLKPSGYWTMNSCLYCIVP